MENPNTVSVCAMRVDPKDNQEKKRADFHGESEVQVLKKQIQQLQQQIAVMSFSSTTQSSPRSVPVSYRERPVKPRDEFFCYRCGEDGHIATKCQSSENTAQVIQKLLRALRKAKSAETDDGQVKWKGPGALTIPSRSECWV